MVKYYDFDEYIRCGEPNAAASAQQWLVAIGLQAVDGLRPSSYLIDVARRNIEGEITISEVQDALVTYYVNHDNRNVDAQSEEADKAAANIKRILSTDTLAFNANGYISVHRRIFSGVFKHAGELRKYDITKNEWVLNGDTVHYLNWEDLYRAICYDIQQEREFSYKGLTDTEKMQHICRFVAGLWQIHPFCEGNTRTTAVFVIQYLRSIGYNVKNDMFATHSWYFRNALVRANYKNSALGIDYSYQYLERFFGNLLLGQQHELKNRFLLINAPDNWSSTQETVRSTPKMVSYTLKSDKSTRKTTRSTQKTAKSTQEVVKSTQETVKNTPQKVSYTQEASKSTQEIAGSTQKTTSSTQETTKSTKKTTKNTQQKILDEIRNNPTVTRIQLAEIVGISPDGIKKQIEKLKAANKIKRIGHKKGGHWEIL